ncbi:hypothetical protein AVEN_196523-1, partial [Araneus ventricosus]
GGSAHCFTGKPPQHNYVAANSKNPIHQLELSWRTLNMTGMIDFPAKCEMRSVIRFQQAEGNSAAENHRRMSRVYGANFMIDGVGNLKIGELMFMMKVDKDASPSLVKT